MGREIETLYQITSLIDINQIEQKKLELKSKSSEDNDITLKQLIRYISKIKPGIVQNPFSLAKLIGIKLDDNMEHNLTRLVISLCTNSNHKLIESTLAEYAYIFGGKQLVLDLQVQGNDVIEFQYDYSEVGAIVYRTTRGILFISGKCRMGHYIRPCRVFDKYFEPSALPFEPISNDDSVKGYSNDPNSKTKNIKFINKCNTWIDMIGPIPSWCVFLKKPNIIFVRMFNILQLGDRAKQFATELADYWATIDQYSENEYFPNHSI